MFIVLLVKKLDFNMRVENATTIALNQNQNKNKNWIDKIEFVNMHVNICAFDKCYKHIFVNKMK